jgi:C4-dicarboxylate-specific signal transduction histidine kinase
MQRFALVAAQAFEAEDQKSAMINASKLATLGELLATIVHEVNQPLSVISMAAQNARLMIETNTPSVEVIDKLATMEGQARRAGEIVKAIRGLAHPNRSVAAPEDVAPEQVVATLRVLCENMLRTKGIALDVRSSEPCRKVRVRPGALEQILLNLISNARDAVLDRMERRHEKRGGRISIGIEDAGVGDQVTLRISDNGGGIPDDVIERVFDPFFTLKEVGSGTGLGLSICRTLLSDMHGSMRVRNDAEGAIFEIALPASQVTAA